MKKVMTGTAIATDATISQLIVAEPAHEERDQERGRDVHADIGHEGDIDHGRHQDRQHLPKLAPFGKDLAVVRRGDVPARC